MKRVIAETVKNMPTKYLLALLIMIIGVSGIGMKYLIRKIQSLKTEAVIYTQANQSYITAIGEMERNHKAVEEQALRSAQRQREAVKQLRESERQLDEARRNSSDECLDSPVPDFILDKLRDSESSYENRSDKAVPKSVTLHRNRDTKLRWRYLVRTRKVQSAVTRTYLTKEQRFNRNRSLL